MLAGVTGGRLQAGKDRRLAHYLLAVSPLAGHLMPMVEIGAHLRTDGHFVTVLTDVAYAESVERAGLRFFPLADGTHLTPPAAAPAWARRLPAEVRRFLLGRGELTSVFVEPLVSQADSLRLLLAAEVVDAVVADIAFTGVLPVLLGDRPRPPILVCGVGPLTLSSVDTPPFGMAWQPEPGLDYSQMTSVAHRFIMGGSQRRLNRALRRADSVAAPLFISDWPRLADGVLQLCVEGFEYPRSDLPGSVQFVGPVLPSGPSAFHPPSWWAEVIDAPMVVHVSQGTFDNTDLDQLISPTLRALAGRDCLVIATTGRRAGQRFSGPVPPNARVIDWLPYPELLPHIDVMITNGGYGGVQYALSHGIPLIVAGETSDKAEVAARVAYSGAGINLGTAMPTVAEISSAVDEVAGSPHYRDAALRLRAEIQTTTPLADIATALRHSAARIG
jgi:UDP:flavonoid glycosyltransferase YjiC (YdhE family)